MQRDARSISSKSSSLWSRDFWSSLLYYPARKSRCSTSGWRNCLTLEGDGAGSEFKTEPRQARRIANAVDKGRDVRGGHRDAVQVLEAIEKLCPDRILLSGLNIRSANPHNGCAQPLHVDSGSLPRLPGQFRLQFRLVAGRFHRTKRRAAGSTGFAHVGPGTWKRALSLTAKCWLRERPAMWL